MAEGELLDQGRADELARSAAAALDRALASHEGRAPHLEAFVRDLSDLLVLKMRPYFRGISSKVEAEEEHFERFVQELEEHRLRPTRTGRALEAVVAEGRVRGDLAARLLAERGVVADPFQAKRTIEFLVRSGMLRWEGEHIAPTPFGLRKAAEWRQKEDIQHGREGRADAQRTAERAAGGAQRSLLDAPE